MHSAKDPVPSYLRQSLSAVIHNKPRDLRNLSEARRNDRSKANNLSTPAVHLQISVGLKVGKTKVSGGLMSSDRNADGRKTKLVGRIDSASRRGRAIHSALGRLWRRKPAVVFALFLRKEVSLADPDPLHTVSMKSLSLICCTIFLVLLFIDSLNAAAVGKGAVGAGGRGVKGSYARFYVPQVNEEKLGA